MPGGGSTARGASPPGTTPVRVSCRYPLGGSETVHVSKGSGDNKEEEEEKKMKGVGKKKKRKEEKKKKKKKKKKKRRKEQ